jgi:hypothetical protein
LVGDFYFSAICKCFDPLLVRHLTTIRGEISVCRKDTSLGVNPCEPETINSRLQINLSRFVSRGLKAYHSPAIPASAICQSFFVSLPSSVFFERS